jgi:MFS family permease
MYAWQKLAFRWLYTRLHRGDAGEAHSLWSHRPFMLLWLGQSVSELGSTMGALGLTALLLLNANAVQMGVLATAGMVPVLLIGLQAGVWVDRLRRRPLLLAADIGRALLLLSVPIAAALGWLRIEQLYVVAFGMGVLNVLHQVAHQSFVPALVRREHIVEGNAKLGVSSHVAEVSGPALGGAVVQWLGAPIAVLVDALSFVLSAALIGRIRVEEPPPPPHAERQHMRAEVAEGLRIVMGNRLLRATVGSEATLDFFGSFYAALYSVYVLRTLGLSPVVLGVAVGAGGVGALVGALLAEPVSRRWGPRGTLIGATAVGVVAAPLTPLAGGPAWLALAMLVAAQFIGDLGRSVRVVGEMSLRQSITPDRLMGRTNASVHWVIGGAGTAGMLVGGVLGEWLGVRPTIWITCAGSMIALVWLLLSPIRGLREYPSTDHR